MLVLLAALREGSLLMSSSFAQTSEAGSIKAPKTETVTKGMKETKQSAVIDGYSLDTTKLPTNASGDFNNQAQQVTYVYTKEAEDITVTIQFVDEQRKPLVLNDSSTFDYGILVPY
ncbi:MucBP domain-containing protein [Listeria monocytogenes]|nr:MucBP domain-containing protein [Listeria monocytogenes]EKA2555655.1 MucBP domain-containing protein [Listeria monocytogenes]EKA2561939.1 MucBP domain-containing protein [Listeria monocytogenes]